MHNNTAREERKRDRPSPAMLALRYGTMKMRKYNSASEGSAKILCLRVIRPGDDVLIAPPVCPSLGKTRRSLCGKTNHNELVVISACTFLLLMPVKQAIMVEGFRRQKQRLNVELRQKTSRR